MNPTIRVAQESDSKRLIPLMNELGYSLTETELSQNISDINKRNGVVLVAEAKNHIVGCVCSIIDIRLAEGAYGEIVSLVVSKKYRGLGVGKELSLQAEKWLGHKVNSIRIRANAIRSDAHSFYKSLGYKVIKEQKILIKNV